MGYYWNDHMNNTNWWPFMAVMMFIVLAALVLAALAFLRHYRPEHHANAPMNSPSSAIAILQERFARGELTEEEYRLRLKMLRDTPPS